MYCRLVKRSTTGVAAALGAFIMWGVTPIYWATMKEVSSFEVVLHRIVWSIPVLGAIILVKKARNRKRGGFRLIPDRKTLVKAFIAGALVTINWLAYVWAVSNGHTLDASLGYYINPLVSVALGTIVLRERLKSVQAVAVGLAGAGVLYLSIRLGTIPWVSLVLAGSFGVYGLVKKQFSVGPAHSLAIEMIPIAPVAIVLLATHTYGASFFGAQIEMKLLLMTAGAVTVFPLLLFGYAAQNIRLSDVGFVQYIAPTMMLLIGVFVFDEVLDIKRLPGFILVWCALALYSLSSVSFRRAPTSSS